MAVAGIDMGSQSTKVVILEGDGILAAVTLNTGEAGENEARQAMEEALLQAVWRSPYRQSPSLSGLWTRPCAAERARQKSTKLSE
jgi:hypothetical protein